MKKKSKCYGQRQGGSRTSSALSRTQIKDLDTHELMVQVAMEQANWKELPSLEAINERTKMPSALLAQSEISPSSKEAIAILAKVAEKKLAVVAQKQQKKDDRAVPRTALEAEGHDLFLRALSATGHFPL